MSRGAFISFEGLDGSGKSTQMAQVKTALTERGLEVIETFEPGGSHIGGIVRNTILSGEHTLLPLTETLLLFSDRYEHQQKLILPALERGATVLADRTQDSTYAYQCFGKGVDQQLVLNFEKEYLTVPDLTFFLHLPVATAMERIGIRNKERPESMNAFDGYRKDFFEKVDRGYQDLARRNPDRFRIVEADRDSEAVFEDIIKELNEFYRNRRT